VRYLVVARVPPLGRELFLGRNIAQRHWEAKITKSRMGNAEMCSNTWEMHMEQIETLQAPELELVLGELRHLERWRTQWVECQLTCLTCSGEWFVFQSWVYD
jgi:hypothetical protein